MKSKSADKIKMPSIDELLGVSGEESATDIEISRIHSFANHPFKVLDDDKMDDLVESIKQNGVLTPVLVRPDKNNSYEMISGHRRMHAAIKAGLETIPAIVRDIEDDEAIVIMVDANIQREELLPSEKAFAYKMKLGAMKRQAGRPPKNNSCQSGTNLRSDEELGNQVGESARSIQRYIRLTELIPDLLDYVDKKRLQFTVIVLICMSPVMLLSLFCSSIWIKWIKRPTLELTGVMKQIEQGDFCIQLPHSQVEEINALSVQFSRMLTELSIEKEQNRKLEMRFLLSQLNPHFLYNTLNSIYWMILDEERAIEACEMVDALSNLLRYGLYEIDAPSTVGQELEHVEQYLLLQSKRYEDRFCYFADVPKELQSLEIPKLTFQPIVENAIKHSVNFIWKQ